LVLAFLWMTGLGYGPALTAVSVTATGFLWADRRPGLILPWWGSFLGAEAITWTIKFVVARHRPPFIAAASAVSSAFRSAHATGALLVYGFLAYALIRGRGERPVRFEITFWTAVLIAAVGFSRIFLSLHYASDVLAGFLVGGCWLLVGTAVSERRRGAQSGV